MKSHHLALSRLTKEHKDLQKKPNPNFFAHPSSSSIFLWNFLLHSLDFPYEGGFYRGQISFPLEYPTKPPNIIFLTPNGRFKVNEKICLSFTGFHPESWSTAWNVQTMLTGLISFMYTKEATTGGITTSDSEKKKLAIQSRDDPEIKSIFGKELKIIPERNEAEVVKEIDENENVEKKKKKVFFLVSILVVMLCYLVIRMR